MKKLEILFTIINPRVLKIFNRGRQETGKILLGVATQDGGKLSNSEIDVLLELTSKYLSLSELASNGREGFRGIDIVNQEDFTFDVSFRCIPELGYNIDEVRKNIQVSISKYLDFRTFNPFKDKIEWENLLYIVRSTAGIKYVYDNHFFPKVDISVPWDKVPRLRSFLLLDKDGAILSNSSSTLSPVYYPTTIDESYYKTILDY